MLGLGVEAQIECRKVSAFCESYGLVVRLKERPLVSLIDLPCFDLHFAPTSSS